MLHEFIHAITPEADLTVITTQCGYVAGAQIAERLQEAAVQGGINDLYCAFAEDEIGIHAVLSENSGRRKVLICHQRWLGMIERMAGSHGCSKPQVLPLVALGQTRRQDLYALRRAIDALGLVCVGVVCDYSSTRALRFELERFLDTYWWWLPGKSLLRRLVPKLPFMSYDVIEDLAVEMIQPVPAVA